MRPREAADRDLAGQSFLLRVHGTTPTAEALDALDRTRPAGVVLFADNVGTPAELHGLVSALQERAAALGLPPLLVAVDQEGGGVTRLPEPFAVVPSQMALAATGDPSAAEAAAALLGRQLRAVGVSMNFAPVLDVNNNPANPVIGTRAFGDDPDLVTRFGRAALRGYRTANVVAVAKHFPGHGDTAVDSHHGLPTVAHPRGRLDRVELAPFAALVGEDLPALMTAHIVFPALDDRPATLSPVILGDLVRGELGFEGVVVTDALEMRALLDRHSLAASSVLAKLAGADLMMPLGPIEEQVAAVGALNDALAAGTVPREAFTATAGRLDRLRDRYGLGHALPPFVPPSVADRDEGRRLAERGVSVVRGGDRIPLTPETRLVVVDCVEPRTSVAEEPSVGSEVLAALVAAAFPRAETVPVAPTLDAAGLEAITAQVAGADAALLVTRDVTRHPHQGRLAADLAATGTPLLHAAVRNPWDVAAVPGAAAALVTYGDAPVSLRALVAVLSGRAAPAAGPLPVALDA